MDPSLLIVTGMPRAGTTLAAGLLDRLTGAVCLNEPRRYYAQLERSLTADDFVRFCHRDLLRVHSRLRQSAGVLDDRLPDGSIPTNYYGDDGIRRQLQPVRIDRVGAADLLIAVKHNELFMSVLRHLCDCPSLPVVVLVRHPIPTLLSWQACGIPLSQGRLSSGYKWWREAREIEASQQSVIDMQARIYNLYCRRLAENIDRVTVWRYEDLRELPYAIEKLTGRHLPEHPVLTHQNLKRSGDGKNAASVEAIRRSVERHGTDIGALYRTLDEW